MTRSLFYGCVIPLLVTLATSPAFADCQGLQSNASPRPQDTPSIECSGTIPCASSQSNALSSCILEGVDPPLSLRKDYGLGKGNAGRSTTTQSGKCGPGSGSTCPSTVQTLNIPPSVLSGLINASGTYVNPLAGYFNHAPTSVSALGGNFGGANMPCGGAIPLSNQIPGFTPPPPVSPNANVCNTVCSGTSGGICAQACGGTIGVPKPSAASPPPTVTISPPSSTTLTTLTDTQISAIITSPTAPLTQAQLALIFPQIPAAQLATLTPQAIATMLSPSTPQEITILLASLTPAQMTVAQNISLGTQAVTQIAPSLTATVGSGSVVTGTGTVQIPTGPGATVVTTITAAGGTTMTPIAAVVAGPITVTAGLAPNVNVGTSAISLLPGVQLGSPPPISSTAVSIVNNLYGANSNCTGSVLALPQTAISLVIPPGSASISLSGGTITAPPTGSYFNIPVGTPVALSLTTATALTFPAGGTFMANGTAVTIPKGATVTSNGSGQIQITQGAPPVLVGTYNYTISQNPSTPNPGIVTASIKISTTEIAAPPGASVPINPTGTVVTPQNVSVSTSSTGR